MSARRLVPAVVAVFLAYIVGRAVGILTGVGPYLTEAVAIAIVIAAFAWAAVRG